MWDKIRKTKRYQICGRMGLIVGLVFCLLCMIRYKFIDSLGIYILFLVPLLIFCLYVLIYYVIRLVGIYKDYKKKNFVKECSLWHDVGFFFITLLFLWLFYVVFCALFNSNLRTRYKYYGECSHYKKCVSIPTSVCDAETYLLNSCMEGKCRLCLPCPYCNYMFPFDF